MNANEVVEKLIKNAESTQRRLMVRLEDLQVEGQQIQQQLKTIEQELASLRNSPEPSE